MPRHLLAPLRSMAAVTLMLTLGLAAPLSAQIDIHEIGISTSVSRSAGVLGATPYSLRVEVEGTGLTSVQVVTPSGSSVPLFPQGGNEWGRSWSGYSNLCDIASTVGFGTFTFDFNAGVDGASVVYNPACSPDPFPGYPSPTAPAHLQANVPLFLDFEWQCLGGSCGTAWFIEVFDPVGPGANYEATLLSAPALRSWTPEGCLTPNTQYMFYIVSAAFLSGFQNLATTLLDPFGYAEVFESVNQTSFTTGPAVGTSYCVAEPNSAGPGAALCASGDRTVASQSLTLVASGCPADTPGLFFFGPTPFPGAPPFGDGRRCVGTPFKRVYPFAHSGPMNGSPPGTVVQSLNFSAPYASTITPGASLHFQFWYRDPAAMQAGFNLTDAVNIQFL